MENDLDNIQHIEFLLLCLDTVFVSLLSKATYFTLYINLLNLPHLPSPQLLYCEGSEDKSDKHPLMSIGSVAFVRHLAIFCMHPKFKNFLLRNLYHKC